MEIEEYSEKSFVVTGKEISKYRDYLESLGGKYNNQLKKDGNPANRFAGVIFSIYKKKVVEDLIKKFQSSGGTLSSSGSSCSPSRKEGSSVTSQISSIRSERSEIKDTNLSDRVEKLEEAVKALMCIVTRLEKVEQVIANLNIDLKLENVTKSSVKEKCTSNSFDDEYADAPVSLLH